MKVTEKVIQIDTKQRDHDAAINRTAFALSKQAHEVRSRVRWEMDRKKLGASEIGRWYVKELNRMRG
jgi:hypothetical protein